MLLVVEGIEQGQFQVDRVDVPLPRLDGERKCRADNRAVLIEYRHVRRARPLEHGKDSMYFQVSGPDTVRADVYACKSICRG